MTTQMIIRVESNLKEKVGKLARAEGKNLSDIVRELLIRYTKERDMSSYIDNLWDRIGDSFAKKDISETDIEEAIKNARAKNV